VVGTMGAEAVLVYFAGGVRPLMGPDPTDDKS